jgi:hypothetical protein
MLRSVSSSEPRPDETTGFDNGVGGDEWAFMSFRRSPPQQQQGTAGLTAYSTSNIGISAGLRTGLAVNCSILSGI